MNGNGPGDSGRGMKCGWRVRRCVRALPAVLARPGLVAAIWMNGARASAAGAGESDAGLVVTEPNGMGAVITARPIDPRGLRVVLLPQPGTMLVDPRDGRLQELPSPTARQGTIDLLPNWDPSQNAVRLLPNYEPGMASIHLLDRATAELSSPNPR